METIKHHLAQEGKVTDPDLPIITHNQRTLATVTIDVPAGREVEANDLIDLAEESLSSPTYEILKRGDEADVVERAHRHPRFVEDVVREILARLLKAFPDFPDGVQVWVRAESEESIHKHNAVAERITTLGELRR
jgi:GTP cyclohydrolase-4